MQPELTIAIPLPERISPDAAPLALRLARMLFSYRVMLAFGLTVITFLTVSTRFDDPDLWFHLKYGEVMWNTHSIPSTDTFSFTGNGHPIVPHEWLGELGIYAVYHLGGYTGLMLAFSLIASLLFVLVYVLCLQYCGSALVAFIGAVCAWFFATVGLAIRPQLAGYVFLVLELILLESARQGRRRLLWILPALFAVWVNVHASCIFGLLLLGVYCAASFVNGEWGLVLAQAWDKKAVRLLVAIVLLSGAALCLNPLGIRLLIYPLTAAVHSTFTANPIAEFSPPDLSTSRGAGLIVAVLAIFLTAILRQAKLQLRDLLVLGVAFALAAQHVRMLFAFGIVAAPLLAQTLAPLLGRDGKRDHPVANALLMAAFLAVIIFEFPDAASIQQQIRKTSPAGAVEYVRRAGLTGPMLNEYAFGNYLIWAMPEHKVLIDGYESGGIMPEFSKWATLSEDPEVLLNKYHIRFCVLSADSAMTRILPHLAGWKKAYSDNVAAVFVR